jgi:hypothetical protein
MLKVPFLKKKSDFGQITKHSLSRTPCNPTSKLAKRSLSRLIQSVVAHPSLEEVLYWSRNIELLSGTRPKWYLVAEFEGTAGKISRSWHGQGETYADRRLPGLSEAAVHDGWMYLGGPFNRAVARIPYK